LISGEIGSASGVSIAPGQIALMRMLREPH
jgi:hypothetical protein